MIGFIPTINSVTFDDVTAKIRRVEAYTEWVHLDIADGTFTKNTLWHDPRERIKRII